MSYITLIERKLFRWPFQSSRPIDAVARAINWAKRVHMMSIRGRKIPSNVVPPTQETTGYIIPTLYQLGEKETALKLAEWEATAQHPDGAFCFDEIPYTFDTAQVIRGLLAILNDLPEIEKNLRRACDYVERQIALTGEVLTASYDVWKLPDGSMLSEYGNLYVLPPILEAGRTLSEPRYVEAAERGVAYFRSKPDLVEFKPELGTLSHYFGYMMEALVDLGQHDLAHKGLAQARSIQAVDGSIPAYPGAGWVCSTGMAQLAVAWYKLGEFEPADRAMDYLTGLQNPSGGFYGGYGNGAQYFRGKEISWAVKFFLDASIWKRRVGSHAASH